MVLLVISQLSRLGPQESASPLAETQDMTPVQRVKVTDPQSTFLGSVAGDVAL